MDTFKKLVKSKCYFLDIKGNGKSLTQFERQL